MEFDEERIAAIVAEVVRNMRAREAQAAADKGAAGIFATVDAAMGAAKAAQQQLAALNRERREELVAAIREAGIRNAEFLARKAHEVTGMARGSQDPEEHQRLPSLARH